MNTIFSVIAPIGAVVATLGSILTMAIDRTLSKRASAKTASTVEQAKAALVEELSRFNFTLVHNRAELIKSDSADLALPSLLGQANGLELAGDVQGALATYEQILQRAEDFTPAAARGAQVVVESAAIAASRIAGLSPRLPEFDAQRILNDATSSLRNVQQDDPS
jgi:hypothetical protein